MCAWGGRGGGKNVLWSAQAVCIGGAQYAVCESERVSESEPGKTIEQVQTRQNKIEIERVREKVERVR